MYRQMLRYVSWFERPLVLVASLLVAAKATAGVSVPSFSTANAATEVAAMPATANMPATGIIGLCIVIVVCVVAGALVIMRRDK